MSHTKAVSAAIGVLVMFGLFLLALCASVLGNREPAARGVKTLKAGVVPEKYRPWVDKAGSLCPEVTPSLLAAQLYQESRFNPQATSPVGAKGLAQFMAGTWKTWGRDDDGNGVASRTDAGDAIMAQGRFMCALGKKAGKGEIPGDRTTLALAGYNAGWGAVTKHRGVPPYAETRDYVKRISALADRWTHRADDTPDTPRWRTPVADGSHVGRLNLGKLS